MKRPFFSIVTISYNQACFLEDAIKSVISQNFSDFEFIVQDPGSTDCSRQIICNYKSSLLPLFEPDSGPADGLNIAFSRATGKFFLFLNSDDRLMPGALKYFYHWINSSYSAYDVYSAGCRIINSSGKVLRRAYSDSMSLRRAAFGQSILIQPSTVFSAESFARVGGFNILNSSNWDGELFVDLALSGCKFTRKRVILSDYRVHDQSITGTGKLSDYHHCYRQQMYLKIVGKPPGSFFPIVQKVLSVERKLRNPHDTLERLFNGPVFKRL